MGLDGAIAHHRWVTSQFCWALSIHHPFFCICIFLLSRQPSPRPAPPPEADIRLSASAQIRVCPTRAPLAQAHAPAASCFSPASPDPLSLTSLESSAPAIASIPACPCRFLKELVITQPVDHLPSIHCQGGQGMSAGVSGLRDSSPH